MAHIADFMVDASSSVGLNNYIARELSPSSAQDAATETVPTEEKEKYIWRMHQPTESRSKYQLFPAKDKLCIFSGRKSPGLEALVKEMAQVAEKERAVAVMGLRAKPKEQTLVRRRKISVPELGPMTTVQEVAMDSPTIPGRPPLHERSISAPGNTWRQHMFGESMISCISGPALDEKAEIAMSSGQTSPTITANASSETISTYHRSSSPRLPLSPKSLAPLVIPVSSGPQPLRLAKQSSNHRLRSGSTPPDVPPKPGRVKDASPYSHTRASPYTPYTPMSASTSSLLSSTTTLITPSSAPEGRSSPKPWATPINDTSPRNPSPMNPGHSRGQSDVPASSNPPSHIHCHRRGESEASIMDRGRPAKRADRSNASAAKRQPSTRSKRSPSAEEQRAFEYLPTGHRATEAHSLLSSAEIDVLRKQAIGQASRFEVLSSKDVESLSRELRSLDERCDYLRKTHRSLRSGRRNLHERICTFLRSPRVARFSHESILKQEEALSELDSSIDDWVAKLEQAENRRTRVRQKLLEHVAGALIMQPSTSLEQKRMSIALPSGEDTPPRSPTKALSPNREAGRVVEQVRVASPEPMASRGGRDVESIRIYADSDVYALLQDVEQEITRMGELNDSDIREAEKKDKSNLAGFTLNAVAFEGLPSSRNNSPKPQAQFV